MNIATTNILVHVLVNAHISIPDGYILKSGLAGSYSIDDRTVCGFSALLVYQSGSSQEIETIVVIRIGKI